MRCSRPTLNTLSPVQYGVRVLGQVSADGAVRITLVEPDHLQATDDGTQFVVTEAELTV